MYCLSSRDPDKAFAVGMTDAYNGLRDLTKSLKDNGIPIRLNEMVYPYGKRN